MARKKGNGEGTIYNNGKYWVGQVSVGRNPETGKIKRKSVYGKTKKEVQAKMTEIKHELNTDSYVEPSSMRVKDWAEYWLENFKKPAISEATYFKIKSLTCTHIIKGLGGVPMKDLTVFQVQAFLNGMQKMEFSDSFINRVYTYLNGMLAQAVTVGLLKKNPCEYAVVPRSGKVRKVAPLTPDEQAALVSFCEKTPRGSLFIFLLGTGVRIGEALALTWDNVGLDAGTILITQTTVEINGHARISENTKTLSGTRVVYLSGKITELLREIYGGQDKDRNTLNLVFPSRNYTLNLSSNIRVRFRRFCKLAGIRYVNIHALRHTFATRALEKGMNVKMLSKMLGHKDVKMTLNTYSHVLEEFEKESMRNIDVFL